MLIISLCYEVEKLKGSRYMKVYYSFLKVFRFLICVLHGKIGNVGNTGHEILKGVRRCRIFLRLELEMVKIVVKVCYCTVMEVMSIYSLYELHAMVVKKKFD